MKLTTTTTAGKTTGRLSGLARGGIATLALLADTALTPGCAAQIAAGQQPVSNTAPTSTTTPSQAPTQQPTEQPTQQPSASEQPSDEQTSGQSGNDELVTDINSATEVTDQYWTDHWQDFFTGTYSGPEVVGLYDGSAANAPTCNGKPLTSDNAYYCDSADYVAWDVALMSRSSEFGNSWVYLVVAHEWGHAILNRLEPSLVMDDEELQADCLAGATLFGAEADGTITMDDGIEKDLVNGLNEIADESPWAQPGDHGDSFQRIEAFNLGRKGGVDSCLPA